MNKSNVLLPLTLVMMLIAIYASLVYAPTVKDTEDYNWSAPETQRIFYIHLPLAITSYLAFFIVFVCGIMYLKNNDRKWDVIALSSAEIGVLFCTLAIITGTIWAKAEWAVFWDWGDMKLNTTLVLWIIFIAYQSVRNSIDEADKRARFAAIYGIFGFAGVPLSYFSFYIWDQYIHPKVVSPGGGGLNPEMRTALIVSMFAFFVFFFYLLNKRIELEQMKERVEIIEEKMEE